MNVMRAISSEGYGRIRFYKMIRNKLASDRSFLKYFEGEHTTLPKFYKDIIEKDLGIWNQWLPEGALEHEPNAYLHKSSKIGKVQIRAGKVA